MNYKALLEATLKSVVEKPDSIKIKESIDNMGVLLTVDAAKEDLKFIIGKKGSMINAIRIIIRTVGMKERATVHIKVNDPSSIDSLRQGIKDLQ